MQSSEPFTTHRPLLFSIAYRMLGSVMDAEDMVQETFLRWQQTAGEPINNPRAYLATIITRLCIDHRRSAQSRHEQYIGPWLPEPLVQDATDDPANAASLADSLSIAFLLLIERLSPADRAVFLLHDVFDYDFEEIGSIVGKSATACRQIAHRARERVVSGRPRYAAQPDEVSRMTAQFMRACSAGDMPGLFALLGADVSLIPDGGGKGTKARNTIQGADRVARFVVALLQKAAPGTRMALAPINGRPGIITYVGDVPIGVASIETTDGKISTIYLVTNPDKLQSLPSGEGVE